MADQWYYTEKKERKGPVSEEQLKELASSGQLKPTEMVWKQGMASWVKVSRVFAPPAAPAPDPNVPPPVAPRTVKGERLWKMLVLCGAGLLFAAFFLPWWSISAKKPDSRSSEKMLRVTKLFKHDHEWYESHHIYLEDMEEDLLNNRIWGWQAGFGIVGLLFSFVCISLTIVPNFVPAVHDWNWIGSFITAILGAVTLIFALVWLLGTPSEEVPPILFQGPSIAAYVYLAGSLSLLGGSITEGVLSLLGFIRFRAN